MELVRRNVRRSAGGPLAIADPKGTLGRTAAWGSHQDLMMLIVPPPPSPPYPSGLPVSSFLTSVRGDGQRDCDGLSFHYPLELLGSNITCKVCSAGCCTVQDNASQYMMFACKQVRLWAVPRQIVGNARTSSNRKRKR